MTPAKSSDPALSTDFVVVICTRGRPSSLRRVLSALDTQRGGPPRVLLVDQGGGAAVASEILPSAEVVPDNGQGLSRARNIAAHATRAAWLVFLDDDCVPDADWAAAFRQVLQEHHDVALVSGYVGAPAEDSEGLLLPVSTFPTQESRHVAGRWVAPADVGFGVSAVRRDWIERLGGWDERFGAGAALFSASEDVDFAYRLFRAGGTAVVSPRPRVIHEQWRTEEEALRRLRAYASSWAAVAIKHVRRGDHIGGACLLAHGAKDAARMLLSGLRHCSQLRVRAGTSKFAGLFEGVRLARRVRW